QADSPCFESPSPGRLMGYYWLFMRQIGNRPMNDLSPSTPYLQSLLPPDVKLRVLVVDDDRGFCDLMVRTFEMIGFEGRVAHDGTSALAALRTQTFDAVLLDILMPGGMTGLEICRELRTFSDIPVVM